jgi:hypothetical protein
MAIVSKQHIILYQHLLVRTNVFVIVPGLHNKARLASLTRHLCRTNLSSNMSYKTSSESCAIEGKRPTLKLLTSRPLSYLLHFSILLQKHSQTCKTDIFNNFLDARLYQCSSQIPQLSSQEICYRDPTCCRLIENLRTSRHWKVTAGATFFQS